MPVGPAPLAHWEALGAHVHKISLLMRSNNDVERVFTHASRGHSRGGKNVDPRTISSWVRRKDWITSGFWGKEKDPLFLDKFAKWRRFALLHGTHPGGGKRVSLQEKKPICVSPRDGPRRTGPTGSGQPTPTLCTNHFLCLGFIKHHIQSRRKSSILPRKCRLSPLFQSLHRNFSSFLIPFTSIKSAQNPFQA